MKKNTSKISLWFVTLFCIYLFFVNEVGATEIPPIGWGEHLPWPGPDTDWKDFIKDSGVLSNVVGWFLSFFATAAIIVIMVWGYMYLTAFGDDDQVTKAKETILYGVVGLLVIILSYALVTIVQNLDYFVN